MLELIVVMGVLLALGIAVVVMLKLLFLLIILPLKVGFVLTKAVLVLLIGVPIAIFGSIVCLLVFGSFFLVALLPLLLIGTGAFVVAKACLP